MHELPDIASFRNRLEELDARMADEGFYADARRAARLGREHVRLSQLVEAYRQLEEIENALEENRMMLRDEDVDAEVRTLVREELGVLEERRIAMQKDVLRRMIPPDPSDERNLVMEIRSGAGGSEASLFAADLLRMYTRFAERRGWNLEQLHSSTSEAGGLREVIFLLKGEEAYRQLKFESGVHRVQRVPVTESQGRIHTSTATVAVLPEAKEVDVDINPADLEITVSRASGPGGQGVNTTDSAVQIIHRPTGITVNCADERSQLKNRHRAMAVLRARLLQRKVDEEQAKTAADRRSQVGTGDRSERIRTYNFPQSRLTDHRIGFTTHDLENILDGDLDELIGALQDSDHQEKIEALMRDSTPD